MENIKWRGEVETWTFPLTDEQLEIIGRTPSGSDDVVEFMAVAPVTAHCDPSLYCDFPQDEQSIKDQVYEDPAFSPSYKPEEDEELEDRLKFLIRFGEMSRKEFENLREHDGW